MPVAHIAGSGNRNALLSELGPGHIPVSPFDAVTPQSRLLGADLQPNVYMPHKTDTVQIGTAGALIA